MAGLLGNGPNRKIKIYREEFPAIFRFDGLLFMEFHNIDQDETVWREISVQEAERWLRAKPPIAKEES